MVAAIGSGDVFSGMPQEIRVRKFPITLDRVVRPQ
jgi:hypothetical protein